MRCVNKIFAKTVVFSFHFFLLPNNASYVANSYTLAKRIDNIDKLSAMIFSQNLWFSVCLLGYF